MRLLLDTHAFIWWMQGSPRLPAAAARAIADENSRVYVSAVSVFEITLKLRLGKLTLVSALAPDVVAAVRGENFTALDLTLAHAHRAGSMPGDHRDPFDRLLMAQALAEDLTLVSNETVFDRFGVRRLW